jgi:carboxymethylenebutenolidase
MCDDRTVQDNEEFFAKTGAPTRRAFGLMSAAALAACVTPPTDAHDTAEQDLTITTPDGAAEAYFVHPASGKHPAVLIWPDIMGLRPAFKAMGKRLAQSGYAVLVVNPFYRTAHGPLMAEGESFAQPPVRERLIGLMRSWAPAQQVTDATAFGAWLDRQSAVDTRRGMGVQGYCMGGPPTFRAAATLASRVRGAASFHGGGLVTDQPDSPHLLIPQTQASFLIAVAQNDDQAQPTVKDTLRQAFDAAHRPAEIEVYAAQHGWCPPDGPAYDQTQAERAWTRLLALYETALA